jgi:hypothetical protein
MHIFFLLPSLSFLGSGTRGYNGPGVPGVDAIRA